MDVEGASKDKFAEVEGPAALLHLPSFDHVAISRQSGSILLFDLQHYRDQGTLTVSDASAELPMFLGAASPRFMAAGEFEDELIFTTSNSVMRACVPLSSSCKPSIRNKLLVQSGIQFWGVGALLSKGTLLVVDRKNIGSGVLYECSLSDLNQFVSQCAVFANKPENTYWDPMALLVDENKQMLYVSDNQFAVVHLFGYDGSYGGHVEEMKGFLISPSSMAMKPGPFATISPVSRPDTATAGVPIVSSISLRTHLNLVLGDDYPIESESHRYRISAEGFIPGTDFTTEINGEVLFDDDADAFASLTSSVTVPYVGNWTVKITEGLMNSQNLLGSPFVVEVEPAPTDPAQCISQFTPLVEAGTAFSVSVQPKDAFTNPTDHASDSFYGMWELGGTENEIKRTEDEFSYSKPFAAAGEYDFFVFHTATDTQIANSPFHFKVAATAPNAARSKHNEPKEKIDSGSPSTLTLQVFPADKYTNPIAVASGYKVNVAGHRGEGDEVKLLTSDTGFATKIDIPKGLETTMTLTFMLGDKIIGDGKPVTIVVAPPASQTELIIIVIVAVLAVAVIAFYIVYTRQAKRARLEVQRIGEQKSELEKQQQSLHRENQNLQEDLRKKKHSDDELEVMKKALDELSQARSDELKECLIDSKEVKVDKMIGKGGFGVVNLATYRGQFVAQKQLLSINDESVKRFRFECFLMKSLRHPNIVKMVGVCWEDDTFACCLEFVENGSLEDWLKKAQGKRRNELTWKTHLLKTAQECALGVEYLHQERYWAEEELDEEGTMIAAGWRECIIHRDLKPDNMLLTNDWTLKLTDFGEARAVQLNQTMTSVGTPMYVAPEVMKGYRYDATADSYSFGICLVAMIRAEKNLMDFYFEALRISMKRKNRKGVGIAILNQRMYTKKWRPLLPLAFEKAYPKLCALIKECWSQEKEKRPAFSDIVRRLNGGIAEEVRGREEPAIVHLRKMDDSLYHEQMKLEAKGGIVVDDYDDDDGGEDGDNGGGTSRFVTRKLYEERESMLEELRKTLEARERTVKELRSQLHEVTGSSGV
jgi:serine/threonine protein kinase